MKRAGDYVRDPRLLTRREFLVWSILAGATASLAPSQLLGAPPLRLGIVGLGGRGETLLDLCAQAPGLSVDGLCDRNRPVLESAIRRAVKAAGAPRASLDVDGLARDPDLDLLVLALPPVAVARAAEMACRAGKDVVLARPAGLDLEQAESLCRLADRTGRRVVLLPARTWHRKWLLPEELVCQVPSGARLEVELPVADPLPGTAGGLGDLVDEFDFLRQVLDPGNDRVDIALAAEGPTPSSRSELRLALRFDAVGPGGEELHDARVLNVLLRRPRRQRPAISRIRFDWPGGWLRLQGDRPSPKRPDPILRELGRLRTGAHLGPPILPLNSALGTALWLSRLAQSLGREALETLS